MSEVQASDFLTEQPPARIMSTETEYSVDTRYQAMDIMGAWSLYMKDYGRSGSFIGNSTKMHKDCEMLEAALPECISASDLVTYDLAAEQLLLTFAARIGEHVAPQKAPRYLKRTGHITPLGNIKTTGYHLNLGIPIDISEEYVWPLTTHLATALPFFGQGMLGLNGELFMSQKAAHIGHVVGGVQHRTRGFEKPMITNPHATYVNNEAGDDWCRVEVRCLDASTDPRVTRMQALTCSLLLRLVEHKAVPRDFIDNDPLHTLQCLGGGTKYMCEVDTISKKQVTNLDVQEELATAALKLAQKIILPQEEIVAAHNWLAMVQDAKNLTDQEAFQGGVWATKNRMFSTGRYSVGRMRAIDARCEMLGPDGLVDVMRKRIDYSDICTPKDIRKAMLQAPQNTRAKGRGDFVRHYGSRGKITNWIACNVIYGKTFEQLNPYVTESFK